MQKSIVRRASPWLILAIVLGIPSARGMMWVARPIVAHEWGVEQFDWSGKQATASTSQVPGYMYTDIHPGMEQPLVKKVKDLPPDSGMRDKPVLYFYTAQVSQPVPIGVEMRFAQGHATAWYPQVNTYRAPAVAAAGHAVNPQPVDSKPRATGLNRPTTAPDDTRMELAWYSLTLNQDNPIVGPLPGIGLPADHWTKLARDVRGAAYVSNGTEAEKYLFYEGATHEIPAIAIVPNYGGLGVVSTTAQIINISDAPIYNVFAIYHAAGRTWVGYMSSLEPMQSPQAAGSGGVSVSTLPLPDFKDNIDWEDVRGLERDTTGRLLTALTEGGSMRVAANELRIPAEPQGHTTSWQLYPDEARSLEKIWHHDFFDAGAADGLTIVYRQSPAQLDADMPLEIFTDMFHTVALNRCGLVVVKNIDVHAAIDIYSQLIQAGATGSRSAAEVRNKALDSLRQHRGMALGELKYFEKANGHGDYATLRKGLDNPQIHEVAGGNR